MHKKKSLRKTQQTRTTVAGWLYLMVLLIAAILFGCSSASNQKSIHCFVASSLQTSVSETLNDLNLAHVLVNAASSGILAKQIKAGAPCDLFISANKNWVDYLKAMELADDYDIQTLAVNTLVLVKQEVAVQNEDTVAWTVKLKKSEYIAIGNPNHVPAGAYALQTLQYAGLDSLLSNKLLEAKDVVSALRLVEMGEADYGFVYKSDALCSKAVKIVAEIPGHYHDTINYYAIALSSGGNELLNNVTFKTKLNELLADKGFK